MPLKDPTYYPRPHLFNTAPSWHEHHRRSLEYTLVNWHILDFLYRELCTDAADTLLRPFNSFRVVFLGLYCPHVLLQ
jgi:hypothetical protein